MANIKKKILFVGWFAFPFGSAGASRVRHIAKGLMLCNYDAEVLTTARISDLPNDPNSDGSMYYDGIKYASSHSSSMQESKGGKIARAFRLLLSIISTWRIARRKVASKEYDALYLYGRNFLLFLPIILWARWKQTPTFFEINEWPPAGNFQLGALNPFFWNDWLGRQLPKFGGSGVVAITTYIKNKYRRSSVPVFVMPSIKEFHEESDTPKSRSGDSNQFVIVYAGSCKKSDGFNDLLDAIEALAPMDSNIRLEVLGNDGSKGAALLHRQRCEKSQLLSLCVRFNGYLSESDYSNMLQNADCLIVPRPDTEAVRAAFPTRLPEFLASGNPVITSDVPDVPLYLESGIHAELYSTKVPNSLASSINKFRTDPVLVSRLRNMGRKRGMECFCYKKNTDALAKFMEKNFTRE